MIQEQVTMTYIRWMMLEDMADVLLIEAERPYPWSESDYRQTLQRRECIGMVLEDGVSGAIIGHMIYELQPRAIGLLNLAIHPKFRRSGFGGDMVAKLQAKLHPERRDRILVEVRESNLVGQLFFRSLGFRCNAVFRRVYDDTNEDAYLFQFGPEE